MSSALEASATYVEDSLGESISPYHTKQLRPECGEDAPLCKLRGNIELGVLYITEVENR